MIKFIKDIKTGDKIKSVLHGHFEVISNKPQKHHTHILVYKKPNGKIHHINSLPLNTTYELVK